MKQSMIAMKSDMAVVPSSGSMGLSTKVSGSSINLMAWGAKSTQMAVFTRVTGRTPYKMGMVVLTYQMETATLVSFKITDTTAQAL